MEEKGKKNGPVNLMGLLQLMGNIHLLTHCRVNTSTRGVPKTASASSPTWAQRTMGSSCLMPTKRVHFLRWWVQHLGQQDRDAWPSLLPSLLGRPGSGFQNWWRRRANSKLTLVKNFFSCLLVCLIIVYCFQNLNVLQGGEEGVGGKQGGGGVIML